MAVFTLFRIPSQAVGTSQLTLQTSTQLQLTAGTVTLTFYGFGFTYSNSGVTGGTVTGMDLSDSANGGLQFQFTGLSHSASTTSSLVLSGGNFVEFFLNGNDTVNGSSAAENLVGYAGNDVLNGGGGNDTLDGSSATADTLRGGTGDDTYKVGYYPNTVVELPGEGLDTVISHTSFTLPDNVENLTIDSFAVASNQLSLRGNALDNRLLGNVSMDTIEGFAGNDTLEGGSGNDVLDGGSGIDVMDGGAGNDTYVVDSVADQVIDASGTDTVQSFIEGYTLAAAIENLVLLGSAYSGYGNALANVLTGNALDNTLAAGDGNDSLSGGAGADNLQGGAGNDTLVGDAGADILAGGDGDDLYVIDQAGDTVVESAGSGTDTVQSPVTLILAAQVENLVLTGTSAIDGTGNELANRITGNAAANVLDGGAGADTLAGLGGSDTYYIDNDGDTVQDGGFDGVDTIFSSVSYNMAKAGDVENLTLTGTADIDAVGNSSLSNVITGNAGRNHLVAVGHDTLIGGAGNDVLDGSDSGSRLDGGTGADTMTGGTWFDTFVVDDPGDVVIDSANPQQGTTDTVESWITLALPERIESLTLMGTANLNASSTHGGTLTGNSGNNVLTGAGTLKGGAGNDTLVGEGSLVGGAGDDTYIVNTYLAYFDEKPGDGIDTLIYGDVNVATLPNNIENFTALVATTITGNSLSNLIVGNLFNNRITGGAGADTMQGGAGDDYYIVDNAGDVVVENAGEGKDTVEVQGGASFSIAGTAVEILFLSLGPSVANSDGTGNALDNSLSGTSGNNILDGGAGADEMGGGAGNDTYIVDNAGDSVLEGAGAGTDTVRSSISFTLPANVENLVLTGTAASGTGNTLANVLTGNASANTLTGGAGNDTIDGDAGSDTAVYSGLQANYTVTRGGGKVTVTGADGTDVLTGIDVLAFNGSVLVLNANLATGNVGLAGLAIEGEMLVSSVSNLADADGTGALSYQWFRNESAIAGATAASYQLAAGDIGGSVSLQLRFVDGAGNTETLWSAATASVAERDRTAPLATGFSPADDATSVPAASNFTVVFNEPIARGTGSIVLKTGAGTIVETFNAATSDRLLLNGNTLTIDPTFDLALGTPYKIEFAAGSVEDLWDNGYAGSAGYNFRTVAHVVEGSAGADSLLGHAADDVMHGLAGNDTLVSVAGDDTLDGGAGVDTVVLDVALSTIYAYYRDGTQRQLGTGKGFVVLDGIERVKLTDLLVAFDTEQGSSPWQADALLWALNGAAPTTAALSQWVHVADTQPDMGVLAQQMLAATHPGISTSALVTLLFNTVLHSTPTPSDLAFVQSIVGPGLYFQDNGELLAYVADLPWNTDRMVGFAGSIQVLDASFFF